MIQPDKPTAAPDDADLDEPIDDAEKESSLLDEEAFLPDDDSDLGLDSEDRTIGLDVDTGLDSALDSDLGDEEEEESWLEEGVLDPSLLGEDDDEDDEDDDDEVAADDTEPARGNAEDWENESPFEEDGTPAGDSGEEGFGEDAAATEIDLPGLPPLDDSLSAEAEERESDALTAELLDELTARIDADERLEELAPGLRCTRMPAAQVVVETLLRLGRPLTALAASGDAGLGWDGSLLVSAAGASPRPERRFAGPDALLALAVLQTDSALLVALATPAGLLCSRDGGRTFDSLPASALPAPDWLASSIAWTQTARGPRLWAAAPEGVLWFSDDLGATLQASSARKGVLKLHADGAQNLIGLHRDRGRVEGVADRAQALRSNDAGASFHTIELPVSEVERVQDVQSLDRVLLCCRRAPAPQLVWRTNAATDWQELSVSGGTAPALRGGASSDDDTAPALRGGASDDTAPALRGGASFACAPAVLVLEDEQPCAYFVVHHVQRSWLMRRVLAAHAPAAQIVADIPADAGAPLQLAAGQHGGVTLLQLGTERAWYRIRVQLAGDAT